MASHPFLLCHPDGSFNRAGIMRHAWTETRRANRLFPDTPKPTLAQALRWAWNTARSQRATTEHRLAQAAEQNIRRAQIVADLANSNMVTPMGRAIAAAAASDLGRAA